jgi:hypothetical protein
MMNMYQCSGSEDPDPYQIVTDPHRTKMSQIRNYVRYMTIGTGTVLMLPTA